jgi:hypothetical protein
MTATATQITLQPGDVIYLGGRYALVSSVVEVEGVAYAGYRTIVGYGKPSERLAKSGSHVVHQTLHADAVRVVERRPVA